MASGAVPLTSLCRDPSEDAGVGAERSRALVNLVRAEGGISA